MLGFLTRDQELITRKVTPGTPCLALTETPERRCEMDDESVREREREREQLRAKVPGRSVGTRGEELRQRREAQIHTNSKRRETVIQMATERQIFTSKHNNKMWL